jgi:hypothetical protein
MTWNNTGTVQNAVADFTPAEHHVPQRAQVMATLDHSAVVA